MSCTMKFATAAVVLIALTAQLQQTDGANILGLFTSHSPSHVIVHMSVMKALAEQGHNITVVVPNKPKVNHEKINLIIIPPKPEDKAELEQSVANMAHKKNSIWSSIKLVLGLMMRLQADVVKDPKFTALYENPDTKFDLIFMGWFANDFVIGTAALFKCPIIISWMSQPMEITDWYSGNPSEVSYVPNANMERKGDRMSFLDRVKNLFMHLMIRFVKFAIDFRLNQYYRELYPTENFPTYWEMQKNVSMVFVNHHSSEGPIKPLVPAVVEIGGIQVKDKPDPLPEDIGKFLNASKQHGAILFSLGSNLQGSHINPDTVNVIFKTFASLKQNVIWKWEDLEKTPGTSKNILYKKWMPQDDILAHPNLKLFITHAGKGGVVESKYHGVPMVALPVFADQPENAAKLTADGYGLHLDLLKLTEKDFKNAILEVITNETYSRNVKKFSELYKDRPLTAKQTAVYWAEYVIRHHGAPHLQSPLKHMNILQILNLDVIAFLFLVIFIVCKALKLTYKFICRKFFKCQKQPSGYKKVKRN